MLTREQKAIKVLEVVEKFVSNNKISCPETISQCDWVLENAYEFIEDLCDVAGYYEYPEEQE